MKRVRNSISKQAICVGLISLFLFLSRWGVLGEFEFSDITLKRVSLTLWIGLILPIVYVCWRFLLSRVRLLALLFSFISSIIWMFLCTAIWMFTPEPTETFLLKHLSQGVTEVNLIEYASPKSMFLEKKRSLFDGMLSQTKVLAIVTPSTNADVSILDGEKKVRFIAWLRNGGRIERIYDTSWPFPDLSGTERFWH